MIPSGGEEHDGGKDGEEHARRLETFDGCRPVIMTVDIVLMATVGLLCLVACVVGFLERTRSWGRRRSRPNGDVLSAIARVEQKISQTGDDLDSRWDYPNRSARRIISER
jgi:hypothetical protein